jgi:parallel beta-helix repeat protein
MRFVLFTLLLLWPIISVAQSMSGKTVWSGSVELSESIRVERGAELIIEPGTTVVFTGGSLEVAGRMQADGAVFSGEHWQGILLKGCDASTTLRNSVIIGAKIGVQVVGGQPLIENNRFINNRIGVELRQKSAATIRGNRFEQNSKVGLFVKDGTTSAITGNRFERHDQYAVYIYRSNPSQFSENSFKQNATGLMVSFAGSDPEVKRNRFVGNKTGIRVERAARPRLIGNTILENEIGIDLYRRSDPEIRGNRIEKNGKGVSIAYSSYPLITQNNFQNNETSLYLEYQSSSWEGEQGGD